MTANELKLLKGKRKISMLTAYDYPTAKLLSDSSIDVLLVGDSMGMVVYGEENTRNVVLEDIIRCSKAVVTGNRDSMVVADMPFGSFETASRALENCKQVIAQTGVDAVKIEGCADTVEYLVNNGIEVMGHTGLKPQTVLKYSVRGKSATEARDVFDEAVALEKSGAFAVVLECVPAGLAKKITEKLNIPVIGIGAGSACDGQVLVVSDLIGLFDDFKPKFVRRYADIAGLIRKAAIGFKNDVESGTFPAPEESYL